MLGNKKSHHNEKPAYHNWRVAPTLHNQRKPVQQRTSIATNKQINKITFKNKNREIEILHTEHWDPHSSSLGLSSRNPWLSRKLAARIMTSRRRSEEPFTWTWPAQEKRPRDTGGPEKKLCSQINSLVNFSVTKPHLWTQSFPISFLVRYS